MQRRGSAIAMPQVLNRGWRWFTNVAVTITAMSVLLSVSGACRGVLPGAMLACVVGAPFPPRRRKQSGEVKHAWMHRQARHPTARVGAPTALVCW